MGALVARLFDYFKKRSSDSQEIEVKQSYWDRLPLEIQRHITISTTSTLPLSSDRGASFSIFIGIAV